MDRTVSFLLFLVAFSLGSVLCLFLAKRVAGDQAEERAEIISFLALFWTPVFLVALLLWNPA